MKGILREFNGTEYPLGFPETVAKHAEQCDECKKNNFAPLCETGSRMLSTWLIGRLTQAWDDSGDVKGFSA